MSTIEKSAPHPRDPFKNNAIPVPLEWSIKHVLEKRHIHWANTMPSEIDWDQVQELIFQVFNERYDHGSPRELPRVEGLSIVDPRTFLKYFKDKQHPNDLGLMLTRSEQFYPNHQGYIGLVDLVTTEKLHHRKMDGLPGGIYTILGHPLTGVDPKGFMYMRLFEDDERQSLSNRAAIIPFALLPKKQ